MIYAWCMALTLWLTCTAWLLIDTRHRLEAVEDENSELKMQVRMLQSRAKYGKDVMPNMTGVTRTK